MARGDPGAFGGVEDQQLQRLAQLLRRSSCSAWSTGGGLLSLRNARSARAALVLRLALVLQPRPRLRRDVRSRIRRSSGCSRAASGSRRGDRAAARRRGLAGVAARRGDRLPRRLPDRAQRPLVERDRRRLLGRDRRRPDRARREPVRALPRRGHPAEVRAGRLDAARCATASRRTAAARPRTRSATPTAPSRTSRTSPATRSSAGATSGTRCRRCTSRRSCSTCSPARARRSSAGGSAGLDSPRRSRSRGSRGRSRQYASNSNTNDAIAPAFLIWGFLGVTEPACARRCGRALRLDEVRVAAARAALVRLSGGAPRPRAVARFVALVSARDDAARLLRAAPRAVAAARGARLLRPHRPLPGRARLAVLDLGLAAVPRQGASRPAARPARARGRCSCVGVARARLLAAPALAAPAGRAHRGGAGRLRARPDALVLPLPAVVLPVRRAGARSPRLPGRRGAGAPAGQDERAGAARWLSPEDRVVARWRVGGVPRRWGLVHRFFWAHGKLVDWPTYQSVRRRDRRPATFPYRDFAVEYPPGALPVFVLPSLHRRRLRSDLRLADGGVRRRARRASWRSSVRWPRSTSRSRRCSSAR